MRDHPHTAEVEWALDGEWRTGRYSRAHTVRFDGGITVAGSASPSVVPRPWSADAAVDPEEMLVAALSACHMLSFLDVARRDGVQVTRYRDRAEGRLEKRADGRSWVSEVVLRPEVACDADAARLAPLHHRAHDLCFIANSVKTEVRVEPAPALLELGA